MRPCQPAAPRWRRRHRNACARSRLPLERVDQRGHDGLSHPALPEDGAAERLLRESECPADGGSARSATPSTPSDDEAVLDERDHSRHLVAFRRDACPGIGEHSEGGRGIDVVARRQLPPSVEMVATRTPHARNVEGSPFAALGGAIPWRRVLTPLAEAPGRWRSASGNRGSDTS